MARRERRDPERVFEIAFWSLMGVVAVVLLLALYVAIRMD
jgi:hypothetical protein